MDLKLWNTMYSFTYDPLNPELPVYDRHPLALILDLQGENALGLNVHWLPRGTKVLFVRLVQRICNNGNSNKPRIRVVYETVKNTKLNFGLVAIRKYRIKKMSRVTEIPVEDWVESLRMKKFEAKFKRQSAQ